MEKLRNPRHMAFVRSHPCCVCGTTFCIEAHHLRVGHGMATKAGDQWTVPLCKEHHTMGKYAVHTIGSKFELQWFQEHKVDAMVLARQLFERSPHKTSSSAKPKSKWKKSKWKRKVDGTVVRR